MSCGVSVISMTATVLLLVLLMCDVDVDTCIYSSSQIKWDTPYNHPAVCEHGVVGHLVFHDKVCLRKCGA